MKTHLSHTLLNAMLRLADAPQQTLSKVSARFQGGFRPEPSSSTTPDCVMMRLENVFEALSELAFQPDITAALELACETLQAELPTEALAAGLYDINTDEIRIAAARGLEHDLVRGLVMPRRQCFAGHAAREPLVLDGGAQGVDWLGAGETGSTVLLCPILHDAHLLGVIGLADPLCAAYFSQDDLELVTYVANQLASFIQECRMRPSIIPPAQADGS